MPTPTYTPIASTTLSSTQSTVTFSAIPSTYRDLILVATYVFGSTSNVSYRLIVNGSTANYNAIYLTNSGTTVISAIDTGTSRFFLSNDFLGTSNVNPNTTILHIFDYSVTDKHKNFLWSSGVVGTSLQTTAGRWADTTAISSIELSVDTGTMPIGATFSLFGISA